MNSSLRNFPLHACNGLQLLLNELRTYNVPFRNFAFKSFIAKYLFLEKKFL